jgi:hypothetical protein
LSRRFGPARSAEWRRLRVEWVARIEMAQMAEAMSAGRMRVGFVVWILSQSATQTAVRTARAG